MRLAIGLALVWTTGCQSEPCPAAGDISVVADGRAADADVGVVRRAAEAFGDWTGGGVCVDTIHVATALDNPHAASLVTRGEAWIDTDAPGDLETRTLHALCHALDGVEQLSGPGTAFADAESFADACAVGPSGTERAAYPVCASGNPQALSLLDDVFVGDWPGRVVEGRWVMDEATWPVSAPEDAEVVPAWDAGAVLSWAMDGVSARPTVTALLEAGPIEGPALPMHAAWTLLGGGGEGPVLVVRDPLGTTAHRYEAAGTTPVLVPPTLAVDEGVVSSGALWVAGRVEGVYGSWRVDLATGAVGPWETPTVVTQPRAAHGRIVMPSPEGVHVFDVATRDWALWTLPLGLRAIEAMPDADGSVSVRWRSGGAEGLARVSGPQGVVEVDVEACGEAETVGRWMAGATQSTWLATDPVPGTVAGQSMALLRVAFE